MGDTRPLPQAPQGTPGALRARGARPARVRPSGAGRRRRILKRAVLAAAAVTVALILAAGTLWLVTPSASEAVQPGQRAVGYLDGARARQALSAPLGLTRGGSGSC
jgi:hypothetical protein